jgi:hypothetical protein
VALQLIRIVADELLGTGMDELAIANEALIPIPGADLFGFFRGEVGENQFREAGLPGESLGFVESEAKEVRLVTAQERELAFDLGTEVRDSWV